MTVDTRADYPVKALLIGGPMHLKPMNFEKDTTEYTVTESNVSGPEVTTLAVPAGTGYFESKYKDANLKDTVGGRTLFFHESVDLPGIHRLPKAAEQARDKIDKLNETVRAERTEKLDSFAEVIELEEQVDLLNDNIARIERLLGAARTILDEAADTQLVPAPA